MAATDSPVEELSVEQCWRLLEGEEFGRLAYRLVDEVHLVPINYVVDGRRILFRTSSGNKLLAAALQSDVAFEIDWHNDQFAWSVVARGKLRRIREDEADGVAGLPLQPWVEIVNHEAIELSPEAVTGRRFRLQRLESDHQLLTRS